MTFGPGGETAARARCICVRAPHVDARVHSGIRTCAHTHPEWNIQHVRTRVLGIHLVASHGAEVRPTTVSPMRDEDHMLTISSRRAWLAAAGGAAITLVAALTNVITASAESAVV